MSKLSALAERIAQTKQSLEARADEVFARLDEMDAVSPEVFARVDNFLSTQESEVQALDDGLRQLSNLPLDEAPAASDNSEKGSNDA